MPLFRVTVRHGRPQQYVLEDIEAPTLADALRAAADTIAAASDPGADLAEVRVQADSGSRGYAGG